MLTDCLALHQSMLLNHYKTKNQGEHFKKLKTRVNSRNNWWSKVKRFRSSFYLKRVDFGHSSTKNTTQRIPRTNCQPKLLKRYFLNGLWTTLKLNSGKKKSRCPILIWINWVSATEMISCCLHSLKSIWKLAKTLTNYLIKKGLLKSHQGAVTMMGRI